MQAVRLLYITALYSMKTSNQFPTETLMFSIHKYCFLTAFSVQHCKGVVSDVCFRPDGFLMPVECWGAALYVCEDWALALTSQGSWPACRLTAGGPHPGLKALAARGRCP